LIHVIIIIALQFFVQSVFVNFMQFTRLQQFASKNIFQ